MLYESGVVRSPGRVDDGTTATDSLDIEKERGISVQAAMTSLIWKNTIIDLIDTPGHIDFSSEVERTLRVMDGAILILSAVEGIQSRVKPSGMPFVHFASQPSFILIKWIGLARLPQR